MNDVQVAVIGAGPAGLSAALWLKNLGFTPVVIERLASTGGMQNFNFLHNDWVLGQPDVSGVEIAKNFDAHILRENIDLRLNCKLNAIAAVEKGFYLAFDDAEGVEVQAIVIASGTRYVGKEILSGCGVIEHIDSRRIIEGPHAFLGLETYEQKHVAIIGAGDNAFENASLLLEQGCEVSLLARSEPKAQARFLDSVLKHPKCHFYQQSQIQHIEERDEQLIISLDVLDKAIQVDRLHILAGYRSNADSLSHLLVSGLGLSLDCDDDHFIHVDDHGRTSIPHIYAAGDVCNTQFPCVVSAVASGALAAKTISQDFS